MKRLPPIVLTDKDQAGVLLRKAPAVTRIRHVVSIGSPETEPPSNFDAHPARKLRLLFDDIEREHSGFYEGPTLADAEAVVRFAEPLKTERNPGVVLVHCAAGISRSAAATLILLAAVLGPGREEEAVRKLVEVKERTAAAGARDPDEYIRPNRRLVWLGDEVLGRGGALLRACVQGPLTPVYGFSSWSP